MKFLITGAKETKSNSRRFRSFQKTGDFETAKGDFFAVFPSNVKYHRGATQPLRTSEVRVLQTNTVELQWREHFL